MASNSAFLRQFPDGLQRAVEETPRPLGSSYDAPGSANGLGSVDSRSALDYNEQVPATPRSMQGRLSPQSLGLQPEDADKWGPDDVARWAIQSLGLREDLGMLLLREEINGPVLLSLEDSDLERMGIVPFGPRRQLLLGMRELIQCQRTMANTPSTTQTATPAGTPLSPQLSASAKKEFLSPHRLGEVPKWLGRSPIIESISPSAAAGETTQDTSPTLRQPQFLSHQARAQLSNLGNVSQPLVRVVPPRQEAAELPPSVQILSPPVVRHAFSVPEPQASSVPKPSAMPAFKLTAAGVQSLRPSPSVVMRATSGVRSPSPPQTATMLTTAMPGVLTRGALPMSPRMACPPRLMATSSSQHFATTLPVSPRRIPPPMISPRLRASPGSKSPSLASSNFSRRGGTLPEKALIVTHEKALIVTQQDQLLREHKSQLAEMQSELAEMQSSMQSRAEEPCSVGAEAELDGDTVMLTPEADADSCDADTVQLEEPEATPTVAAKEAAQKAAEKAEAEAAEKARADAAEKARAADTAEEAKIAGEAAEKAKVAVESAELPGKRGSALVAQGITMGLLQRHYAKGLEAEEPRPHAPARRVQVAEGAEAAEAAENARIEEAAEKAQEAPNWKVAAIVQAETETDVAARAIPSKAVVDMVVVVENAADERINGKYIVKMTQVKIEGRPTYQQVNIGGRPTYQHAVNTQMNIQWSDDAGAWMLGDIDGNAAYKIFQELDKTFPCSGMWEVFQDSRLPVPDWISVTCSSPIPNEAAKALESPVRARPRGPTV